MVFRVTINVTTKEDHMKEVIKRQNLANEFYTFQLIIETDRSSGHDIGHVTDRGMKYDGRIVYFL